ncbi:hypothetical protein PVAP13_5KG676807 [Panicum virgatum]|uniref:Uncharacterized protein n=1 Tax=Panicum virgatum TaxID=38727 RepID=A0A8T0T220_PANVG|nr:hypothetical protein PVAP13_5KG676807 [Panicum virgatum]
MMILCHTHSILRICAQHTVILYFCLQHTAAYKKTSLPLKNRAHPSTLPGSPRSRALRRTTAAQPPRGGRPRSCSTAAPARSAGGQLRAAPPQTRRIDPPAGRTRRRGKEAAAARRARSTTVGRIRPPPPESARSGPIHSGKGGRALPFALGSSVRPARAGARPRRLGRRSSGSRRPPRSRRSCREGRRGLAPPRRRGRREEGAEAGEEDREEEHQRRPSPARVVRRLPARAGKTRERGRRGRRGGEMEDGGGARAPAGSAVGEDEGARPSGKTRGRDGGWRRGARRPARPSGKTRGSAAEGGQGERGTGRERRKEERERADGGPDFPRAKKFFYVLRCVGDKNIESQCAMHKFEVWSVRSTKSPFEDVRLTNYPFFFGRKYVGAVGSHRMEFSKYTRTVHAPARRGGPCREPRPGHVSE